MISMQRSDVIAVKRKPQVTEIISLLIVMALFIVLVGCGARKDAAAFMPSSGQDRINTVAGNQSDGTLEGAFTPKNEVLSKDEKELVMLFKELLEMDHQSKLLISENQAISMLPSVSQSSEDGGMNPETEKKIRNILTTEQKTFLDDNKGKMQQFTDEINIEQQMIDLLKSKIIH
jgi:hypothetical protein